jgi:hypothetical protein
MRRGLGGMEISVHNIVVLKWAWGWQYLQTTQADHEILVNTFYG